MTGEVPMTTLLNIVIVVSVPLVQVEAESAAASASTDTPCSHSCCEGFDYPPFGETLNGKPGGKGFDGPWIPAGFNVRNHDAYRLVAGSLTSSDSKPGKGYMQTKASAAEEFSLPQGFPGIDDSPLFDGRPSRMTYQPIKGIGRRLARPIDTDETTTLYVAALIRPDSVPDGEGFGGYIGFYLDGTGNSDLFVGVGGANQPKYCLENRGGDNQILSDQSAKIGRTDLLVVKAEFRLGTDVFTLFVNPDTSSPEPATGTVKRDLDLGRVHQLVLYSTGAYSMDELRIVDRFSALSH